MMKTVIASASAEIDASPQAVYALLSDYTQGHPSVLPKAYFTGVEVEAGGRGAGTLLLVKMRAYGRQFTFRQQVSEPEPGRVLVETDRETGLPTTFTLDALDGGSRCRVTITTEAAVGPGLSGWIGRWTTPPFLRRVYREELENLQLALKGVPD